MSTADRPPSRKLLLIVLRVGLLLSTVLMVELGFRGLMMVRGNGYSAAKTAETMRRLVGTMSETLPEEDGAREERFAHLEKTRFIHPYVGWETNRGNVRSEAAYQESVRRTVAGEEAEDEYRVWIVGGSVSGYFGKGPGAETFAAALAEDPRFAGKNIVVDSYGRGAYKQPQQAILIAYNLSLGMMPDAVLNIDGFNEVAIANQNFLVGVNPVYPSLPQWGSMSNGMAFDPEVRALTREVWRWQIEAERCERRYVGRGLHRSAILGWIGIQRLHHIRTQWAEVYQRYEMVLKDTGLSTVVRGLPIHGIPNERRFDTLIECWLEGSRSIAGMCEKRSIPYLHVLQPTLHDEGAKQATPEEIEVGQVTDEWIEGARLGYPLLRDGGAILRGEGIAFADASLVFVDITETLYTDGCHFNDQGNQILGRFIAEQFLAMLPE